MTAIKRRRTRSTLLALLAAIVGLGAAGGLTLAGINTLADSTAGREADGPSEVLAGCRYSYSAARLERRRLLSYSFRGSQRE